MGLIPWGWHYLSIMTLVAYGAFFVVYNDEITAPEDPGVYEFGDTATGEGSWISEAWDVITFGAFNDQVTLPQLASVALFLLCGIWWMLIAVDIVLRVLEVIIPG